MAAGESIPFEEALRLVSQPETIEKAFMLYEAFGRELVFMLALPFLTLFVSGAVVQGQFNRSFWEMKGFWIIVALNFMVVLVVLAAFPYLLVSI